MSECPQCKRRLAGKTACKCGWVMPGFSNAVPSAPVIPCCYANCVNGALCRVWTKTGWANVCTTHYTRIETVPRPRSSSPQMAETRAAYEASSHYRRVHGVPTKKREADPALEAELQAMREKMATVRQPGQDDEDPLGNFADLQEKLMDMANP